MPPVFRYVAGPHGAELRLQPERHLLPRSETRGAGDLHGRRRGGPRRDDGQHHREILSADGCRQAGRRSRARRHELLPVGHRRQAAAHPDLPHGGGQPLQGRMPAGGDEPPDRRHHLRRESGVFGARPPLSGGMRPAERADLRHGLADGGGAAVESGGDRGVGHPQAAWPGEGQVPAAERPP